MRFSILSLGVPALFAASPAFAQDTAPPPPVAVSGSATVVTDYRFRGITQSDEHVAVQGTLNATSTSGFYVGTFASTIDDDVSLPGYGDAEIDLYAGYSKTFFSGIGVDAGLLYYLYPDGADGVNTDFFEPYASVSYTIGPINAKVGGNYAWGGQSGLPFEEDSLYLYGEASVGIPTTPVTLKAHVGRSDGSLGLVNPDATDDDYWDWSVGATASGGPLTVGISYIDTDISNAGGFAQHADRGATVLGSLSVGF